MPHTLLHQIQGAILRKGLVFLLRVHKLEAAIIWWGSMFSKKYVDSNISTLLQLVVSIMSASNGLF